MKPTFPIPEPKVVWGHFFDLVSVPRPSKDEGAAVDFIDSWAKRLGFATKRDSVNNICVHVPATGSNAGEPVLLQCHLDIVSVTEEGNPMGADASAGKIPMERGDIDPKKDKKLSVNPEGDWINSPFTTLGADNGIGVAMMMALAEKKDRKLPLQLLFTIDEEAGMTGAIGLEPDALGLTAKMLINIDTEDDEEITVGSAGGRDVEVQWSGDWESLASDSSAHHLVSVRLKIDGLKGGHSGIEINQGRANANRLLARILNRIHSLSPIRLSEWRGGSRRNAIPDKSWADFVLPKSSIEAAKRLTKETVEQFNRLYVNRDNSVGWSFDETELSTSEALTADSTATLLRMVQSIPTGICEMTPELPVLVESSCNMAIIEAGIHAPIRVVCSVRGTTSEALSDVSDSIQAIVELAGGKTLIADGYPGWKPILDSHLLTVAIGEYAKLFGEEPVVHAVHAGLECGLLVEKLPGLSAISMGPTIKGNHAVGERVSISSVAKSYRYLEAILEVL